MPKLFAGYNSDSSPTTDDEIAMKDTTTGLNRRVTLANLITAIFNNTPTTSSNNTGWVTGKPAPTACSYLGNRSYQLTYAASIAGYKTRGMRNKFVRTVTAPTKCTDLESGSTQYFNKTSPNKCTFIDDFGVMAWIKVESHGAIKTIMSRYNGTSGWSLQIGATGKLRLVGYNTGAANFSYVESAQTVVIGEWMHVALQLDMSAFTATTTTSFAMIDGVDVPCTVSRGGTNPSTIVQAGNLEVGAQNGGTLTFDGKMAQAAYFQAKVAQATILTYISQTLAGTETNLGSAYTFDNVITDKNTTTPNDLTAQGSATATNADSPYAGGPVTETTLGTTEYAITTNISADGLTEIVQVPLGFALPTSGGISALSYSPWDTPYGLPRGKSRWQVWAEYNGGQPTTASNATWQLYASASGGGTWALSVPAGDWKVGYDWLVTNNGTTQVNFTISPTNIAGVAAGSEDIRFTCLALSSAAALFYGGNVVRREKQTLTALTVYNAYSVGASTGGSIVGNQAGNRIIAELDFV